MGSDLGSRFDAEEAEARMHQCIMEARRLCVALAMADGDRLEEMAAVVTGLDSAKAALRSDFPPSPADLQLEELTAALLGGAVNCPPRN